MGTTDRRRVRELVVAVVGMLLLAPPPGAAQGLEEFDYENLAFRGVGIEVGAIVPTRVEPTATFGARVDLGYLGPGLRIVPGFTYWSSDLRRKEVRKLEEQVERLIQRQTPGVPAPDVDLGRVSWSDIVLSVDGHFVWRVPYGVLTYAGAGVSAHLLNGEGPAVDGTFVEDLLDTVNAGANLHGGLEVPVGSRVRIYGLTRVELLEDVQYVEFRIGGQLMFGPAVPGELGGGG